MSKILRIVLFLALFVLAACQAHGQTSPNAGGSLYQVRPRVVPERSPEEQRIVCLNVVEVQYLFPREWHRFDRLPCVPAWFRVRLHLHREAEILEGAMMRLTA